MIHQGKNSDLLSGSYWRPIKKNYWSLRFEPLTNVIFWTTVESPQENVSFFFARQTRSDYDYVG